VRRAAALVLGLVACRHADEDRDAWAPETSSSTGVDASSSGSSSAAGTSESSTGEPPQVDTSGDESSTGDGPMVAPFARYPAGRVHSPITGAVAMSLQTLRARGPAQADDVFMKVGASSDVSPSNLHCFATGEVDLDVHAALGGTLDVFLAGDAAGTTPFDRESLATQSGRSASWAIEGDPSPLVMELDAIAPGLAFVHYGTNDMGLGADPGAALPGFYESMSTLLDTLEARGVVPLIVGLTHRLDDEASNRWIATYNEVLRAMAQARQIPFVDIWWATDPLPGHGLGGDGLHLESFAGGPCIFTPEGLQHGYNVRNLIQLEALDRVELALADEALDDDALPPVEGEGSAASPFVIDVLPFLHDGDTTTAESIIDVHDCAPADESGPEVTYTLDLAEPTALRVIALDREGVDVDVHVRSGATCLVRDDSIVAGTFAAGPLELVIDSWSDGASAFPGQYVLAVVRCDDGDPACAG
jgi:hypothetical protein